jgi:hypothetical protein
MKKNQVALHVRVKFNETFEPKCLGEEYLIKNEIIYICDNYIYNDAFGGDYVHLKGYSIPDDEGYINSGYAYLTQLDLEFPIIY